MYLAVISRPDILHSISKLSQRNTDPHVEHESAAKHVLRYLSGTVDLSLHYCKSDGSVDGFTDADWANDKLDRKSYSGYTFFMAGGVFSWASAKQSVVALSSTEAEYIAMATAAREAAYLQKLLTELDVPLSVGREVGCTYAVGTAQKNIYPMTINCDNTSAQHIATNPVQHKRTKHIDIKYHYIREKVKFNEISLKYVNTEMNVADLLTKSLCKQKHCEFVRQLGLY
ncbi:hypothetical protein KR067_004339 [Drosophila pandora]|nr:hypothetical protein KR067_004339 [Drosophila pandora]